MFQEQFKKTLLTTHALKLSLSGLVLMFILLSTLLLFKKNSAVVLVSPLPDSGLLLAAKVEQIIGKLSPASQPKKYEVFGFAPHWSLNKLDNVDFNTLTTLAYFGIPVDEDGEFVTDDPGYIKFTSQKATEIFNKAHSHDTKVVLTVTQMNNKTIKRFLDNESAQRMAVRNTLETIQARNLDGVNIDFEYLGDPGAGYRQKFSNFVGLMSQTMRTEGLLTSTSVYAASAKQLKMYDISSLAQSSDKIFMMAYDYATTSTDNAIPTAPLYGHTEGKYWYDVSTAVEDFLSQMPAEKLILGTPWYGYNLLVYEPSVKAETRPWYSWRGKPTAQTYGQIEDSINADMPGILDYKEGWDDLGKTRWRAYHVASTNTWRMVFYDDVESLGIKYDFAKDKKLAGVGIWALGFDNGRSEMWDLLKTKFGPNSHSSQISRK